MPGTQQTRNPADPHVQTFANSKLLAAGTYDFVATDPTGAGRCASRVVALAADAGWTITDADGNTTGPIAVPVLYEHKGYLRGITCASAIAVFWG